MTQRSGGDDANDGSPAYADASRPVGERVESLLDRMTVAEKVGQTVGTFVGRLDRVGANSVGDAEELVRERGVGSVAAFGIGISRHRDPREVAEVANRVQRVAVEETRLGIPVFLPVDAVHGHAFVDGATVFPHGQGMAATRDPELVERAAAVTARELRATGANHNYAPTADVAREPRWGRTFETYAESPHLTAELTRAEVRGYQRPDAAPDSDPSGGRDADEDAAALSPDGVAATVKHFPAYSDPERGEDGAPVETSETGLRRTFLPSFEAALDAGAATVMPCYNSVDAEPAHGSTRYLRDLLRAELGFEGVVASDWNGVRMLETGHRVVDSYEAAVERAREAGVDVASVGDAVHLDALGSLVESGDVSESLLDESVRRILELKFRLGLFEDPYADPDASAETLGRDAHRELAREAARRSMTLLRNEGDALPFSPDVDDVLVTGPNADSLPHQCGGWTGPQSRGVTVREGVERVLDAGADAVTHVPGAGTREPGDVDAAAAAAGDADAAVVVLGEPDYFHEFARYEGESGFETGAFPTRTELALPDAQRELLREVMATETPTALVLVAGRPLAVPWAAENVPAILGAYYPGAEGGLAAAETLFGENDPSGLLPTSVPRSTGHLPTHFDHLSHPRPTREPEHPSSYDPLFAFGHGLHYADFEVESVEASAGTVPADGTVDLTVTVRNVGDRAGTFAADAFLTDRASSRVAPVRERRGTVRAAPAPGERTTVSVAVEASSLGVVGRDGEREVEPGEFEVSVGDEAARFEVR